ncbi:MAG: FAD:protein FMN transferase [Planctomycetes bacterium]|nr:FAD:protein FMN transferase [Planctomycetota bacterium]
MSVSAANRLILGILSIILPVSACAPPRAEVSERTTSVPEWSMVRVALGSVFDIRVYDEIPRAEFEQAADEIAAELTEIEACSSVWSESSEVTELNRRFSLDPSTHRASDTLWELLTIAGHMHAATRGTFDITIGPVIEAYGIRKQKPAVPDAARREMLLKIVGFQHLHFDHNNKTVSNDVAGVALDFDGINKGYAVDRIADCLNRHGVRDAAIDAGGSTIFSIGPPPDQTPRMIGIEDPTGEVIAEVSLRDAALSTSGNWRRLLKFEGKTYGHICDPRTALPIDTNIVSATVVVRGDGAGARSDALAKGAIILGEDFSKHLVDTRSADEIVYLIKSGDGAPTTRRIAKVKTPN